MSTVADYIGRTVDVLAFQGVFPSGREQLLVQELARTGGGGSVVTGIQKLVQKVLLTLLTRRGSKLYDVDAGTDFLTDANAGLWRTVADVEQSFYSARLDVSRQLRAQETATDPDDERFGSLELTGVTLSGTTVSLRMTVTSVAGSAYVFVTPIDVAV